MTEDVPELRLETAGRGDLPLFYMAILAIRAGAGAGRMQRLIQHGSDRPVEPATAPREGQAPPL